MSSPVNNFLSLIPAVHRVAIISPFASSEESIVPIQKTRRSSSTATADSTNADEPTLPTENEIVESPTDVVDVQIAAAEEVEQPVVVRPVGLHQFLKLGN